MTTPSPDARAVVAAVDRLTTQLSAHLRHLADTRSTPTDGPSTTCDASTIGIANRHLGPCTLRDGHDGPVHRGPEGETWWAAVVAEAHTLADGTEAGFRAALAADDEEQQRTARRARLHNLLARTDRSHLTPGEVAALRELVNAEQNEADIARAITADHQVENRALREKLERYGQAQAALARVRKALDDRPPILNAEGQGITDYETGWRDHDALVRTALDGTGQPNPVQRRRADPWRV